MLAEIGTLPLSARIELLTGEEETSMVETTAIVLERPELRKLVEAAGDETGAGVEEVLGNMELEFVPLGTVCVSTGNEEVVFNAITASTEVDEADEVASTAID